MNIGVLRKSCNTENIYMFMRYSTKALTGLGSNMTMVSLLPLRLFFTPPDILGQVLSD